MENQSAQPAELVVAADGQPFAAREVGTVKPATVRAGQTIDVSFGMPPGDTWAIFVNPGLDMGPLVMASDVPADASGRMKFKIVITQNGEPAVEMAVRRGWFGN